MASGLQKTLQSLIESGMVWSSLAILNENGILKRLEQETEFGKLKALTHLPEKVLEKMLQILVQEGFLVRRQHSYCWSTDLTALIESAGLEMFCAQLKFNARIANEFFRAASTGSLTPDWYQTDGEIIKSWGQLSQFFGKDFVSADPRLVECFSRPNALFLDAGTGTGAISIQLCKTYPKLKVVAIDCAEKPLALAQENIQQHHLMDRIELRNIYLQNLQDTEEYDVVWFPQVFYSEADFLRCLQIAWDALKPSGMIYMGVLSSDQDSSLSNLILQLKNATYGSLRYVKDAVQDLKKAGFADIKTFDESREYKSFNGYSLITAVKL